MLPDIITGRQSPEEGELKQPLTVSFFHTPGFRQVPGTSVGGRYPGNIRFNLGSRLRQGLHHLPLATLTLVSIVSLVAIASCIALRFTHQKRAETAGLVRRSLSDPGDEQELSFILEQCLELEEELGLASSAPTANQPTWGIADIYGSVTTFERARSMQQQTSQEGSMQQIHGLANYAESHSRQDPRSFGEAASSAFNKDADVGLWRDFVGQPASSVGEQRTFNDVDNEPRQAALSQSTSQQQALESTLSQFPSGGQSTSLLNVFDPDSWLGVASWQRTGSSGQQHSQALSRGFVSAQRNAWVPQGHAMIVSRMGVPNDLSGSLPVDNRGSHFSGAHVGAAYGPFILQSEQHKHLHASREPEGEMSSITVHGYYNTSPESIFWQACAEGMQESNIEGADVTFQAAVQASRAESMSADLTLRNTFVSLTQRKGEEGRPLNETAEAEVFLETISPKVEKEGKHETTQPVEEAQVVWDRQEASSSAGTVPSASVSSDRTSEKLAHPYVRLPAVDPKDIPRAFRRNIAFSSVLFDKFSLNMYKRMRRLFAKPSLESSDVENLLRQCEYLVNFALHKLSAVPRKVSPFFVARRLAELFFMFDYVVCTIELLQEKMETGTWWEMFAASFRIHYYFPDTYKARRDPERRLPNLIKRLTQALAIYKRGVRPPQLDIIELKRDIFKLLGKHGSFGHKLWNLWKKDDSMFCRSGVKHSECD